MSRIPACPQCAMEHVWLDRSQYACPDCGHEWPVQGEEEDREAAMVVRDANGNPLHDGDSVLVIKDLKVKGSSLTLKQGTMIRAIRLVADDPEHIEGNSERIRDLVLKTCFLKKV